MFMHCLFLCKKAFYGLQGMSDHFKSTRCILSALTQKVSSMPTLTQLKDWAKIEGSSFNTTVMQCCSLAWS